MQENQKTAVIILNYNNYEDTINCIKSIKLYNTASIKYIIVDNGSNRKGTVTAIDEFLKQNFADDYKYIPEGNADTTELLYTNFIVSPTNDGYARGNNKALNMAYKDPEIENILIINNDVLFIEDIIPRLISKLKTLPKCGIVSPILYKRGMDEIDYNCARLNHTEWEIINTLLFLYRDIFGYISLKTNQRLILKNNPKLINAEQVEIELPSGSCMLIKKELMKQIGGFDPHTFLYFEENILYKKIKELGLQNYLIPQQKCIHLGASSTSKSNNAFILNKGINSIKFYLTKYCILNQRQKALLYLGLLLMKFKILLIKSHKLIKK